MGKIKPYKFQAGLSRELAKYKNALAFVREAGANINDQSKEKSSQDKNRPTMRIWVSKLQKKIWIEDWQTGIISSKMEEFLVIGNKTTSRDDGKQVGDIISSYNNIVHDIFGQKHVGKLSYLFASKIGDVEYWSNNGENGHYLHGTYDGWETFDDTYGWEFKVMDTKAALEHIGLRICINDPKDECLSIRNIEKAAQNYFDVLIAKDRIRILITDIDKKKTIQVHAPADLNTNLERTDETLTMYKGGNIIVNLAKPENIQLTNNIRVYCKDIFVCTINYSAYLVKGYINWDGLELNKERENYEDDPEFKEKLENYLKLRFPLAIIPQHPQQIGKKTEEQIQEIVNEVFTAISQIHAELLPEGLFGPKDKNGLMGSPTKEKIVKTDIKRGAPTHEICHVGQHWDTKLGKCIPYEKKEDDDEGENPKDDDKRIRLVIKPQGGQMGPSMPTMFFKTIPIENGRVKLELFINWSRPACEVITKPGDDKRRRDVLYDKFIRAAFRLTYKGNDINEFENLVDETWNILYIPNREELIPNK